MRYTLRVGLVLLMSGCVTDGDEPTPDPGALDETVGADGAVDAEPMGGAAVDPDAAPADATPDAAPAGCETDDDCDGPRRCIDGACVACLADVDCIDGYICEAGECAEGCRESDTCPLETYCQDGACVPGCDEDARCELGVCEEGGCLNCEDDDPCLPGGHPACEAIAPPCACDDDNDCALPDICFDGDCQTVECAEGDDCPDGYDCNEDAICQVGCVSDARCGPGRVCEQGACADGCRNDAGCVDALCEDDVCVPLGVACRDDGDCGIGEQCAQRRCAPAVEMCPPDRLEPNDAIEAFTPLMFGEQIDRVSICPGDRDLFGSLVPAGQTVRARLNFDFDGGGILGMRLLDAAGAAVAGSMPGDVTVFLEHTVEEDGVYLLEVSGVDADARNAYVLTVELEAPPMCVDTRVFPDEDGDGFGVEAGAADRCLDPDEATPGFAHRAGDCSPADPWGHPESSEICGDWVDDDCDGVDQACPESRPAVQVPDWACVGAPPANVYGWARFADGGGYFRDGGCFVFFEGLAGEFYVKRALDRANDDPTCARRNGCTCPSLGGWPAYDRRMYAFTLAGDDPDACEPIEIRDHAGEAQAVSNACRKYLYQMHFYDIPYSLVAIGQDEFERRLDLFPTVEVACAADLPHRNLPYQSLLTAPIERNPDWAPIR